MVSIHEISCPKNKMISLYMYYYKKNLWWLYNVVSYNCLFINSSSCRMELTRVITRLFLVFIWTEVALQTITELSDTPFSCADVCGIGFPIVVCNKQFILSYTCFCNSVVVLLYIYNESFILVKKNVSTNNMDQWTKHCCHFDEWNDLTTSRKSFDLDR